MAVRASDRVTLAVLPAPTYVRTYYLIQASALAAPSVPTTNPPPSPWSTTEPTYTAGSTDTLYTVMLVAYGTVAFEYGPVQKSTSFEAAKQAYNLAAAANTAASTALTTANGKNKVTFSTAVASGTAFSEGDLWFQKSGTTIIGQWEFTGGAWAARTLTNAVISTLDAAKITTGELNASRIAANSVSLQKLLIANFTNMAEDPGFEVATAGVAWTRNANATSVTTNMRTGARAMRLATSGAAYDALQGVTPFQVEKDEVYRIGAWIRTEAGAGAASGVALRFLHGTVATTVATSSADLVVTNATLGTTYTYVTGQWTVPAGAKFARPSIVLRDAAAAGVRAYLVDDVFVGKALDGSLIVDGAVTAIKLNAVEIWANEAWLDVLRVGVIETSMVTSGFADELVLSGNQAISLVVEQQSEQANQIAATQSQAEAAQVAADAASDAAAAADDTAAAAALAAEAAQAAVDAANAEMTRIQTWFRVDGAGAHVGQTGSPFQTNILPGEFNITDNGVRTTWWDSGNMTVNKIKALLEFTVGKHQFEADPAGTGTVIKSVG